MKKGIITILIVVLISTMMKSDNIIIPNEAIRFRVIANSDSIEDQEIKSLVRKNLEKSLYTYLKDANNLETAKESINDNLGNFEETISHTLLSNHFNYGFNINYGLNYFPAKEFKGIEYKAGEYESLVVTLGKGEGSNWWCVLFPPLCLLEAEENDTSKTEYQFFVKKLIDKYLK